MQKDYFCPGTGIWTWICPNNVLQQICQINGYKSTCNGVSGKNGVKMAFI